MLIVLSTVGEVAYIRARLPHVAFGMACGTQQSVYSNSYFDATDKTVTLKDGHTKKKSTPLFHFRETFD